MFAERRPPICKAASEHLKWGFLFWEHTAENDLIKYDRAIATATAGAGSSGGSG